MTLAHHYGCFIQYIPLTVPLRGGKMRVGGLVVVAVTSGFMVFSPSSVAYAQTQPDRASVFTDVAACRAIPNDTVRLSCYDRAVALLDSAEQTGDIVVLDRAQVRDANRQLFGFQFTNPFAGRLSGDPEPEVEAIETSLTSATAMVDAKWVFRLADGSEWRQVDSGPVRFSNRAGVDVRVRRAALGSYMMTLDGSRAVRVRRQ